MIYNFDFLPDRRNTESAKWNYYPEDALPMWVADMDFVSPEPVIRALQERVAHGVFGYPYTIAQIDGKPTGLAEIILQRLEERYSWRVQPQDLLFVPGVVAGFNMACHALAAPESGESPRQNGVLVQTPVYPPFLSAPANAGMARQEMELTYNLDGTYSIDWDAFEAAITPETRMFLLCNPHNPIGRVYRRDELERMAEICLRHELVICSDEIHCDLLYSGQHHIPIASLNPEIAQRTITLIAPSKTYNIAGLACAVAIIQNDSLRRRFSNAHKGLAHGVNVMGWVAAEAAYRHGQEWLDQLLVYLEANRDFLFDYVRRELPSIRMAKPESTYLAWLDCRAAGIEGRRTVHTTGAVQPTGAVQSTAEPYTACEFFLKQAKVAFNDGKTFGRGGEGFVRLNFGCPRSMLVEALERMKRALQVT